MFAFIMKGGVLIYPILLCSVIALAIILERLYHFSRAKITGPDLVNKLKGMLVQGEIVEARRMLMNLNDPAARVALTALGSYRDPKLRDEAVGREGAREIRKLERNLRGLSIICNITPLLGLLGTVTGMIRAFIKIQELGGKVDAAVLAGGIWEAMITTGAGLAVAIPVMVAYHLFEGRVDNIAAAMKDVVSEIGELIGVEEVEGFVEESKMRAIKEEEGYGV